MNETTRKYDPEERTAIFGEKILIFCKSLKEMTMSLRKQTNTHYDIEN